MAGGPQVEHSRRCGEVKAMRGAWGVGSSYIHNIEQTGLPRRPANYCSIVCLIHRIE